MQLLFGVSLSSELFGRLSVRFRYDAGEDRGHDLVDGSGLGRGAFPVGEQQMSGPDQRRSERVDVGVERLAPISLPVSSQQCRRE